MAESSNPNPNPNHSEVVALTVTEDKCDTRESPKPTLALAPAPAPAPAPTPAPDPSPAPAPSLQAATNKFQVDPINLLIRVFTGFSLLLSIPILFSVVWLLYTGSNECEHLLRLQRLQLYLVLGLGMVFVASNLFLALRSRALIIMFLIVILLLIVMLNVGLGLTGSFHSRNIHGSPRWILSEISDDGVWADVKSCIYNTGTCKDLSNTMMFPGHDFNKTKLSYIESGCCRPPPKCGMVYVRANYWTKGDANPTNISTTHATDCDVWNNEDSGLCYDCYSCKEGFQKSITKKWSKIGKFMVVIAVLLGIFNLLLFLVTMVAKQGRAKAV